MRLNYRIVFNKTIKIINDEFRMWVETIAQSIPGRLGRFLRHSWYRGKFRKGDKVSFGRGCEFLSPQNMSFEGYISIGKNSFFTAEGGSITVDSATQFNTNVHINASVGGKIQIGKLCLIGPNVVMRTAGHRFDDRQRPIREQGHTPLDIIIKDNVWIGANSVILGGVCIGEGSVVGAGAVVTRDIPSMAVALGVPARVIKYR